MAFFVVVLFSFVGLVIFLTVRSILLSRRLQQVEERLSVLERSVRGLAVQRPTSTTEERAPALAAAPDPATHVLDARVPHPVSPVAKPPSSITRLPSRTRDEWEAFVGGRLLNRIGAFAIIIGIGFFLKHAFDNNWISEPVRVLIGAACGVACLAFARRTHQQGLTVFSQGLVGAGIGILYLSVYASFNFYSLLPQIPSFILMTAVTVLALAQGIQYRSLAVALLGWAGGYLTPWMLSTGEPNEVRLFAYLALLTVGLLGLTLRVPAWNILQPLTAAGTWVWYLLWFEDAYASDAFAITLFFLLVFWASFVAADHAHTRSGSPFGSDRLTAMLVNALAGAVFLYRLVEPRSELAAGVVLVLMGCSYPVLLVQTEAAHARRYIFAVPIIALLFLMDGTAVMLSDYGDVAAWAGLAWLAVAAGQRRSWPHLIVAGQVTILLAAFHLLTTGGALAAVSVRDFTPVMTERTLGFAGLMAGSFLSFMAITEGAPQRAARQMFLLVAGASLAALITVEVNDLLRVWRLDLDPDPVAFRWFLSLLFIGTLWVLLGSVAFIAGVRERLSSLMGLGVFLLGAGAVLLAFRGIAVPVIAFHHPVLNVRVLTMLAGAAMLLACAFAGRRYPEILRGAAALPQILAVAAVAVVFAMFTGEARDWFERSVVAARDAGPAVLADLLDEQQLAISVVWLLYSVALMAAGFWRSNRGLRFIAMGLFGITILKIFLYDLSSLETGYRIVSFIGLGGILLGVSYGYQRFKHLLI